MELIDKSTIVAEIKRIEEQNPHIQHGDMLVNRDRSIRCNLLEDLHDFLDTLEVKEVDLEKEIYEAEKRFGDIDEMGGYRILIFDDEFRDILRHFYELGLKAKKGE